MHDYDRTSKWLIEHHGDPILRIAGVRDVVDWRPSRRSLSSPGSSPMG